MSRFPGFRKVGVLRIVPERSIAQTVGREATGSFVKGQRNLLRDFDFFRWVILDPRVFPEVWTAGATEDVNTSLPTHVQQRGTSIQPEFAVDLCQLRFVETIPAIVDHACGRLRGPAVRESPEEDVVDSSNISCLPNCVLLLDPIEHDVASDCDETRKGP